MPKNTVPRRASAPKKPKTIAEAAIAVTPQCELPDWLTATDPESMYQLSFRGEDCDVDPLIQLTRSEFIALRHHLAELRGYIMPKEDAHA